MPRGVPLTPDEQATLRAAFDGSGGSFRIAAAAVGCSTASARRYLRDVPKPGPAVATVATIKTTEAITAAILELAGPLFRHMMRDEVIGAASLKDTATSLAILIDKYQLLTGQATSRTDNTGKISIEVQRAAEAAAIELGLSVEEVLAQADAIVKGAG